MKLNPQIRKSSICLLAVVTLLLLNACEMLEPTLRVKAVFNQNNNINDETKVLLNGVKIGVVKSVTPKGTQSVVELQLNAEKAKTVQINAAALIEGSEPVDIVLYNPATAAAAVKEGDTLLGLNSSIELVAWQAGDAIASTVDQVNKTISSYFSGEEWNKAKDDMNDLLGTLEQQGRATHDDIVRNFEDLIRNLEIQSEQALAQASKELKAITDKIAELHAQGKNELARILQQLVDELDRALRQKQQVTPPSRTI